MSIQRRDDVRAEASVGSRPLVLQLEDSVIEPRALTYLLTEAALEKKAVSPVILNVEGMASYADYFLIASGSSTRQVQAVADFLERKAREHGVHVMSVEGRSSGKWVLLDFGSVVVHVFYEPVREFYDLEGLWVDAPRLPLPPERSGQAASAS